MSAPVELPKVYIYVAGTQGNPPWDYLMVAVSDDAELIASHVCSHPGYARGDLHDRPYRHAAYVEKFGGWGDGKFYDLVEVPYGESPPAELMELIRANNAQGVEGDVAPAQDATLSVIDSTP